jgi:hypothetical protein
MGTVRETLWTGGIVSIAVPKNAKEGAFPLPEGGSQKYLQFARTVLGGIVNIFVHDPDSAKLQGLRGKTITAEVSILRKMLDDDREYLFVNLTPSTAPATHRLAILAATEDEVVKLEGFVCFETFEPLRGTVVIAPIDSKIKTKIDESPIAIKEHQVAPTTWRPFEKLLA